MSPSVAGAKPLTAVVVDDSRQECQQIAGILQRRGVSVIAICDSGTAGLQAIRTYKPTIATIDNQMPGLDGISVVRTLVAEKSPTLLVMCSGTAGMKAPALAAGARGFIGKPYDNVLAGRELEAILGKR